MVNEFLLPWPFLSFNTIYFYTARFCCYCMLHNLSSIIWHLVLLATQEQNRTRKIKPSSCANKWKYCSGNNVAQFDQDFISVSKENTLNRWFQGILTFKIALLH